VSSCNDSSFGFFYFSAFCCQKQLQFPTETLGRKEYQNNIITEEADLIPDFRKYEFT
jgi:hypothetical protein